MTSPLVNDTTSWVVGKIAQYPQQIAKNGIRQITNLAIDAVLPKNEASKFLKEIAPDLVMIIGDGVYYAVNSAKTTDKAAAKATKEIIKEEHIQNSVSRATLKKIVKIIHDAL